jgi:hypothetical protein
MFVAGTSIGKRYARTDEIGVPLAITVDSTTSVTARPGQQRPSRGGGRRGGLGGERSD